MNTEKFNELLKSDINQFADLNFETDFEDVELKPKEWVGLKILCCSLAAAKEELQELGNEYPHDKDVQFILEVCNTEGIYYTLVHKLDVGIYVGFDSTLAAYAQLLKGASTLLKELLYGVA